MARPLRKRCIHFSPKCRYFKPAGLPLNTIQEIELKEEEIEAIRLTDGKGLYRAQAAKKMQISRQTFDRIIRSAHQKIAQALTQGHALKIINSSPSNHKEKKNENRRRAKRKR